MTTIHFYPCFFDILASEQLTKEEITLEQIAGFIQAKYECLVFDKYIQEHERNHVESGCKPSIDATLTKIGKQKCRGGWRLQIVLDNYTTESIKIRIIAIGDAQGGKQCYAGCGKYTIVNPKIYQVDGEKYKQSKEEFSKIVFM
jgi:hypothetical protein